MHGLLSTQQDNNQGKYPLLVVDDLLDQLAGAQFFTRINLRSGYHQIRVAKDDVEKTAFWTRYGSYEWLVMSFGLTGAPGTFNRLSNDLFCAFLDEFVILYIDDLLIYSKTLEEHMVHVKKVLQILRENKLYANPQKCEFAAQDINFLGFRVGKHDLHMDTSKVDDVRRWLIPTKTVEVQQSISFVQYVRKFIKHFSVIAPPLTNLTKAKTGFKWTTLEQDAFEKLKEAVCSQLVLKLPDFTK